MTDIKQTHYEDLETLRCHLKTLAGFSHLVEDILKTKSVVSIKFISISDLSGILNI